MTLMLTSCAAVPESKTEDGVNYAVSNSEKLLRKQSEMVLKIRHSL